MLAISANLSSCHNVGLFELLAADDEEAVKH